MPNHCNNIITVSGPIKELRRFLSEVASEKSVFDFNKILPCPKELLDVASPVRIVSQEEVDKNTRNGSINPGITQERHDELVAKHGTASWYDWCCENWGTKWGAYDVTDWVKVGKGFEASYDSAWAPPTKGLVNLSKSFPLLSFRNCYMETGMDFCGYDVIENGEVIEAGEDKISSDTGLKFCEERFGYEPYVDDESVPV